MTKLKNLPTFEEFINVKDSLMEGKAHNFGCAMLFFNNPTMKDLHDKIEEDDVYIDDKDPSFGLEDEPHVTLLYGIHDDEVKDQMVFDKVNECELPENITLKNISLFESDKYDVLKFDIDNDMINTINEKLCELPFSTDYPEYHAHSTVGYIKKGLGKKYVKMFEGQECEVKPTKIVYSKPDGNKVDKVIN